MRNRVTFDPSGILDMLFRKARAGSKVFIFTSGGNPYDISGIALVMNIKARPGMSTNMLQLTVGSGLTVGGTGNNELTVALTDTQTDLPDGIYYWELYNSNSKKTWLCGNFQVYAGVPDELSSTTEVTVNLDPDVVQITINESGFDGTVNGGTP